MPDNNDHEFFYDEDDEEKNWEDNYNPDDYVYGIVDAVQQMIAVESKPTGIFDSRAVHILLPIIVTPINKFIYYPEYPYEDSLILDMLDKGYSVEDAVAYTMDNRVSDYINDYILKDENGNEITINDLEFIEDDSYPNIDEPFWYINIK